MTTRTRIARAALLSAFALLTACADRTWMTVSVRDRDTYEPIPAAHVRVENTGINPLKPEGDEGDTDPEGSVRLRVAAYNRLYIIVRAEGRAEHVMNGDHPLVSGDSGWFGPKVAKGGERATIEVRLTP
ncbi:MAG: hypothetical protein AB7G17_10805 [Phycisphaerales bacterium]